MAHVHISDCDGKVHGDLPPGRGVVDFPPYLDAIKHLDIPDAAISIELEYSPEPDKIVEWVTEAYTRHGVPHAGSGIARLSRILSFSGGAFLCHRSGSGRRLADARDRPAKPGEHSPTMRMHCLPQVTAIDAAGAAELLRESGTLARPACARTRELQSSCSRPRRSRFPSDILLAFCPVSHRRTRTKARCSG